MGPGFPIWGGDGAGAGGGFAGEEQAGGRQVLSQNQVQLSQDADCLPPSTELQRLEHSFKL